MTKPADSVAARLTVDVPKLVAGGIDDEKNIETALQGAVGRENEVYGERYVCSRIPRVNRRRTRAVDTLRTDLYSPDSVATAQGRRETKQESRGEETTFVTTEPKSASSRVRETGESRKGENSSFES